MGDHLRSSGGIGGSFFCPVSESITHFSDEMPFQL